MLTELNLKTFAISFNYQVRLQKAIQLGPAIQFLSFIVYLVCTCMSRSQSWPWNLQRPRDQCELFYKTATVYFRSKESFPMLFSNFVNIYNT